MFLLNLFSIKGSIGRKAYAKTVIPAIGSLGVIFIAMALYLFSEFANASTSTPLLYASVVLCLALLGIIVASTAKRLHGLGVSSKVYLAWVALVMTAYVVTHVDPFGLGLSQLKPLNFLWWSWLGIKTSLAIQALLSFVLLFLKGEVSSRVSGSAN